MLNDATNLEKFWFILKEGRDVYSTILVDQFNIETHFDLTRKRINITLILYDCFINKFDLFNALFFNMFSCEAQQIDSI